MVLAKVFVLRKMDYNHSDPRISCIMLHKIYALYKDLKQKETLQSSLVIKNLKSPPSSCVIRHSIHINLQNCTSQETYNKFHHTYKTSILDCHNCGTVMRLDFIQMDNGLELSIITSSSRVNAFGNTKQEKDTPSGVLL